MLSYLLYTTASLLVRIIPPFIADRIAVAVSFIFYAARASIRRNVAKNLDVLGLHGSSTFAVFRNFSRTITDFLRLEIKDDASLQGACRILGREHLDRALRRGRGAILFSAHLGPWEVAGACLASMGYCIHTVALEHPSHRVTSFFSTRRSRWGINDCPPGEGASTLIQALREGGVVVLLVDRNLAGKGTELPFFGKNVPLPDGHVVLAMRTGAPLLPSSCYYTSDGTIEGVIEEPIELPRGESTIAGIGTLCLEKIESHIKAHPSQWFAFDHLWPEE